MLAVTFLVLLALRSHLSVEAVALVLLLPPLVAALAGRVLALVMAAIGAVTLNYFFIKPYYSFSIDTSQGVTAFVVYAAVALTVAIVAGQLRESREYADRRIAQERAAEDVAIELLRGGDPATRAPLAAAGRRRHARRQHRRLPGRARHPSSPTARPRSCSRSSCRARASTLPISLGAAASPSTPAVAITRDQQQVVNILARMLGAGEHARTIARQEAGPDDGS